MAKTLEPKKCVRCSKLFQPQRFIQKYCTRDCFGTTSEVACKNCNRTCISYSRSPRNYCSKKCYYAIKRQNGINRRPMTNCKNCGKSYGVRPGSKGIYCSIKCAGQSQRKIVNLVCKTCGIAFTRRPSEIMKLKTEAKDDVYCGTNCYMISKRKERILMPCYICGKMVMRTPSEIKGTKHGHAFCSKEHFFIFHSQTNDVKYENIPHSKISQKKGNPRLRLTLRYKACIKIDPRLKCINCGCAIFDLIEISHENNDGNAERQYYREQYKGQYRVAFLQDIVSDARRIDDLALRCKICNILHYVEQVMGAKGFTVTYDTSQQKLSNLIELTSSNCQL